MSSSSTESCPENLFPLGFLLTRQPKVHKQVRKLSKVWKFLHSQHSRFNFIHYVFNNRKTSGFERLFIDLHVTQIILIIFVSLTCVIGLRVSKCKQPALLHVLFIQLCCLLKSCLNMFSLFRLSRCRWLVPPCPSSVKKVGEIVLFSQDYRCSLITELGCNPISFNADPYQALQHAKWTSNLTSSCHYSDRFNFDFPFPWYLDSPQKTGGGWDTSSR